LSEHGDVIETQTVSIVPPKFFSELDLCLAVWRSCDERENFKCERTYFLNTKYFQNTLLFTFTWYALHYGLRMVTHS